MFHCNATVYGRRAVRLSLLVGGLAALFALLPMLTASAQSPTPTPPADVLLCVQCHTSETESWQASPHASSAVTCEACHGEYKPGHPATETMPLGVDSATCSGCHSETYRQWESTLHAKAGVQCIGCHVSHSQDFRLTDEALCGSCHRDTQQEFDHSTHGAADVTCVTCHVSSLETHSEAGMEVPTHQFAVVSEVCLGCHSEGIHRQAVFTVPTPTPSMDRPLTAADETTALLARIESLERSNRNFQTVSVIGLGLGLGVGGLLGIVLVLIVGQIVQRGGK